MATFPIYFTIRLVVKVRQWPRNQTHSIVTVGLVRLFFCTVSSLTQMLQKYTMRDHILGHLLKFYCSVPNYKLKKLNGLDLASKK